MFSKVMQRLVEPGASFFGDIGSGFNDDVVLLRIDLFHQILLHGT
jgi:hypothetical protein